jgi:hypothetical protein
MQQIIRWPDSSALVIDHPTAKLVNSSYLFQSWSQPPWFTTQIVNCIFVPAQAVRVLSCRMMINTRTGSTTNLCQFTLRIIDTSTGNMLPQLPTSPLVLNPMDTLLFPLTVWQTVYQAIPASSAPVVNTGEYFGVVFTGVVATTTANNLQVKPLIEVLIEF